MTYSIVTESGDLILTESGYYLLSEASTEGATPTAEEGTLISALITEVRTDITDDDSTRFTDAQLLNLFKKAIRRCNRIVQRQGFSFARKSISLTTIVNQNYIDFSTDVSDFDVWIGLYRDDTHKAITKYREEEWETVYSASELECCLLDQVNSRIYFNGAPASVVDLTLWYYPVVDPSAYTTASYTPWGGRLDDIIMEYVAIRAKNIDEMDVSVEMKLMADMESQIIDAYAPNSQTIISGNGWL